MGATAFILVGNRPYLTPGLPNPGYLLVLYENGMPAWELIPLYPELGKGLGKRPVIWIPSIEHMLEDALLMIGIYVTKDAELVKMAEKVFGGNFKAKRIEIGGNPKVEKLREIARRNLQRYDIGLLIVPLPDSTIVGQLDHLKRYGRLWYSAHIRDENLSRPFDDLRGEEDDTQSMYTEVFLKIFEYLKEKSADKKKFESAVEIYNSYRERFRRMSDDEIYQTLVGVVFYSGMNSEIVSRKMPTILKYLGNYRKVARYGPNEIKMILMDPNMIRNRRKIKACIHNAREFEKIISEHGSFSAYLDSFGVDPADYEEIQRKLVPELIKQFKGIGKVTVYHFLMDIGFGVMKPDRTILRLFYRLGWLPSKDYTEENIEKTIEICRRISEKTGLWIRTVDIILVAFCQEGVHKGLG